MYSPVPATLARGRFQAPDLLVVALIGLILYGMIATAQRWDSAFQPEVTIDLSLASLPLYSLYSLFRALIAYFMSLGFTLSFGYLAAKNRFAERLIIPMLDIGQSIPVLGFLPGLVLGLVALFPRTNVGLELACVIMIFTGQVWNMTFSYISSLKAVPDQLHEMASNVGLGRLRRLLRIELPCAATGLAWNSLMSMAGGWFFLTVCESFTLGSRDFRVPGLGSYMALAIERGNRPAMIAGVSAMVIMILFMDFVVWRPIIAWTAKFRLSESRDEFTDIPFMSMLLKGSPFFQKIIDAWMGLLGRLSRDRETEVASTARLRLDAFVARNPGGKRKRILQLLKLFDSSKFLQGWVLGLLFAALFFISGKVFRLIEPLRWVDWREIIVGTGFTFIRVIFALLVASIWAVPAGIWIGLSPRWTRIFQPLIQLGASFPAPMLYPLALVVFTAFGMGLGFSSSLLMLLGVQWYVLFNVLAGAIGISQDLRESFRLIGISRRTAWLKLYLPSVFPSLVTGWVTAAGGAWNASIVSEYIQFRGSTLKTRGLGALISEATASGNFPLLAACLIAMIVAVVTINRAVWGQAYRLAETRFRFER